MNTVFIIKNMTDKIFRRVMICAVICAVILAVLFVLPQDAYALNSDYMNYGKWMNNEKVTSYTLNYENAGNTLTGKFRFYTDSSLGVYTDFEISETSLGEADNVCVTYDFHMPGEDFIVYVDRYGLSEGSNEQGKSVFKAEANFDSKGTYISAAQYVGGQYDSCYVDIILKINGHNYNITKNKKLYGQQLYMELPTTVTTTRSTTLRSTAKKAAKKKKKSTTQKKKSTGSAISKSKAAARAKISTTKFKPNYNITTAAKQQKTKTSKNAAVKSAAAVNNSDASEEAQISQESAGGNGDKFEINPQAKQFFPLLLIIVIIGVAALCIGAAKNKKEKKDGKEEENKEENNE